MSKLLEDVNFCANYSFTFVNVYVQLAEGKHEELSQKGLNEKKELQLKIEEMEEKEQALQARIEALQADNDFTNERLTALQGKTHKHALFLSAENGAPSYHGNIDETG